MIGMERETSRYNFQKMKITRGHSIEKLVMSVKRHRSGNLLWLKGVELL
jgi:hypothetical protein